MNQPCRRTEMSPLLLALFACLVLLPAARALAIRPQVVDAADFFKPETQDQADQVLRDIKQRFGKDLMIETYPAVPKELQSALKKKGKEHFYSDWSNQRFRALGVNGVYILITRNPGRVQIAVGNVTQQQSFTLADRDELLTVMIEPFRTGKFDEALLNGIDFVQKRMGRNANAGGANPEPLPVPPPGPGTGPMPTSLPAADNGSVEPAPPAPPLPPASDRGPSEPALPTGPPATEPTLRLSPSTRPVPGQ